MLLAWMTTLLADDMAEANAPDPRALEHVTAAEQVSQTRPYVRAVTAAVLKESPRSADVEDCVQETLRRALEHEGELRSPAALRAWVTGIARHVALDLIRARQRARARTASTGGPLESEGELVLRIPDPRPDAERALSSKSRVRAVEHALAALPEGQREAVSLFFLEDKSYQDIAKALGVPMGTVATWVARGRARVIAGLQEQENE